MKERDESEGDDTPATQEPRKRRGMLRRAVSFTGGLLAAAVLSFGALVILGIPVELDWVKRKVESAAAEALGRSFAIEGPLTLMPAIPPAFQIEGVRIGNANGWPDGDLARLDLARARLRLLYLLKGEVLIEELTVEGLDLNLQTDVAGDQNWLLKETGDQPDPGAGPKDGSAALRFIELAELSLRDIRIQHEDARTDESVELALEEISGNAEYREPMHLRIRGTIQKIPYKVAVNAGSLADLVDRKAPWALEVEAEAVGASLRIHGEVAEPLRGKGLALDFDLTGPRMKDLEVLLGTELPAISSFGLRGHLEEEEGKYRVVNLEGEIAATGLTGHFEADTSGERPLLSGAVDVRTVDVGPLLAAVGGEVASESARFGEAPKSEEERLRGRDSGTGEKVAAGTVDLDEPVLTLDPLRKLDARFDLKVHEVVNMATSLRDAKLAIVVADGRLTAPLSVTLADVPFEGGLSLSPEDGQPKIAVSLSAEKSDIGELARLLSGAKGVEGRFEAAKLALRAKGETTRELVMTSELRFDMTGASLSYGHDEVGGTPVELTLDEAHMLFPASDESTITASGALLGEPFTVEVNGGTFTENFVQRQWPLRLTASGGGANFQIDGTVRRKHIGGGSEIAFSLAGEPIGGLATWIGIAPEAKQSYELTGAALHNEEGLRIRIEQARVGRSSFAGAVGVRRVGKTPVTFARLDFEILDLRGLEKLVPEPEENRERKQGKEALAIDVPILPKGIELFDSDVDIAIARIKLETTDIRKVVFSSKIDDGYLQQAPIGLTIAGSRFEGNLGADLRGEVPQIDLEVGSSKVDVGRLLASLGVAHGVDLTAGAFDLDLAMEGSSLREVLRRSRFSASFGNGYWRLDDHNTQGRLDIQVSEAQIRAEPQQPIGLTIDGRIERTPVKIEITTDSLASFAEPKDRLKMDVGFRFVNAELSLTGTAPLPVQARNLHFSMDLRGKRLSDFDPLLDVRLPPVGPYRLKGAFGTKRSGYYVKGLQASIGASTLSGRLDIDTRQRPPRLDVDLAARTIQLDDFRTGGLSASGAGGREPGEPESDADGGTNIATGEPARDLLSPEVMRKLNAEVGIRVQSVKSGDDWLGSGKLRARLQDGRFQVDPLTLDIPGGSVELAFALQPGDEDMALEAAASIEKLDYGILARRIDPKSDTGGIISLDLDLKTRGPDLRHVMRHSNGHIDFALAPRDLNAGVFDIWAVNLFVALMPSLDDDRKSKVNCVVARFGLSDGIMRPNALLIDSSRIQASADGVFDFKAETVELKAKPKSKRPQMFSAKTPVQVKGRFSDFKVGLPPGALAGTVVRMVTSPVVVPFQWVFTAKEPADGRVACARAWQGKPPQEVKSHEATVRRPAKHKHEAHEEKRRKKRRWRRTEDVLQPGSGL
jgi:uncharacterized protein involved in outer membrane biogenesis